MSNEKHFTHSLPVSSGKSRRIRIIKNLIYLITAFDFLIHYAISIELNAFESLYQRFGKVFKENSSTISLCQLPIKQYIPFSLSDLNLYILYFSILTSFISIEATRKSSVTLYQSYIIIKFILAILFFSVGMIYILIDQQIPFIFPSLNISYERNSIALTVDICLTHVREKLAIYLLSIVNVMVFLLSVECSKVFTYRKIKFIQV